MLRRFTIHCRQRGHDPGIRSSECFLLESHFSLSRHRRRTCQVECRCANFQTCIHSLHLHKTFYLTRKHTVCTVFCPTALLDQQNLSTTATPSSLSPPPLPCSSQCRTAVSMGNNGYCCCCPVGGGEQVGGQQVSDDSV